MLDDELTREDIENAILKGRIEKRLLEDIRARDIGWPSEGRTANSRYM